MLKTMDRWLALVAAVICVAVAILIAVSPVVDNNDVKIPLEIAMWARHWFEAGLIVFAIFFIFIHITVNRKPK